MDIMTKYASYLEGHFGLTTVIFDGYDTPNTKDHEHSRRSSAKTTATVPSRPVMKAQQNQNRFLSNNRNKTEFIKMLASHLQSRNHAVEVSEGDADIIIVKKAITLARNSQCVTVIAEDTDIYVLLIHHWAAGMAPIYMQREFVKLKREQSKYSIEEACDKFESMVASCSKVETQKLPPINRAAYYHALRVHLQIRTWSELDEVLDPTEFG